VDGPNERPHKRQCDTGYVRITLKSPAWWFTTGATGTQKRRQINSIDHRERSDIDSTELSLGQLVNTHKTERNYPVQSGGCRARWSRPHVHRRLDRRRGPTSRVKGEETADWRRSALVWRSLETDRWSPAAGFIGWGWGWPGWTATTTDWSLPRHTGRAVFYVALPQIYGSLASPTHQ